MAATIALLPHERLQVFEVAMDFAALADSLAVRLMKKRPDLSDQLRRASASAVLNIAEGSSEFRTTDKSRFYRYARRSAAEAAAAVALAVRCGALEAAAEEELLPRARRLGIMLIHLIRSMDVRK